VRIAALTEETNMKKLFAVLTLAAFMAPMATFAAQETKKEETKVEKKKKAPKKKTEKKKEEKPA
jgi:hypothetical protein